VSSSNCFGFDGDMFRFGLFAPRSFTSINRPLLHIKSAASRLQPRRVQVNSHGSIHARPASTSSNPIRTVQILYRGLVRWAASPYFYYQASGLGVAGGSFYIYNVETIPVSGRRRFNIISPEQELAEGKQSYAALLQQYQGLILPDHSKEVQRVRNVLRRLVGALGHLQENEDQFQDQSQVVTGSDGSLEEWTVHVIKDKSPNAFVIPG
jgi:hypothetical protein